MARLTRRQRMAIDRAVLDVQAVKDYIMGDRVAVCRVDTQATTTLHFQRPDGRILYEVERAYGSPLCRLDSALTVLELIDARPIRA